MNIPFWQIIWNINLKHLLNVTFPFPNLIFVFKYTWGENTKKKWCSLQNFILPFYFLCFWSSQHIAKRDVVFTLWAPTRDWVEAAGSGWLPAPSGGQGRNRARTYLSVHLPPSEMPFSSLHCLPSLTMEHVLNSVSLALKEMLGQWAGLRI